MFYFTCNESKIYESFTFWNNCCELFHNILIYWDAPVFVHSSQYYVKCTIRKLIYFDVYVT